MAVKAEKRLKGSNRRTLKWSTWLGWQLESNWTRPFIFAIYAIAKPIASALILVVMFTVISYVGGEDTRARVREPAGAGPTRIPPVWRMPRPLSVVRKRPAAVRSGAEAWRPVRVRFLFVESPESGEAYSA